jgi:hypothetical protein
LEAEYLISEDEYVRANKLFTRLNRKYGIYYAVAVAAFVAVAVFVKSEVVRFGAIFGLIGGIIGHVITRHAIAPWQTRRLYRTYRAVKEPVGILLEEDGLRFRGSDTNSLLKWQHLIKWRENQEFILVYQNSRLYHIIPKRLGSSGLDIAGLIAKIEANIGSAT